MAFYMFGMINGGNGIQGKKNESLYFFKEIDKLTIRRGV